MNKKSAVRNYGIDLLRIAAMFMVLLLHVLGQGGILKNLVSTPPEFLSKYSMAWLLETASYCSVNCYAIITGYNYYGIKVKWNKIVDLWLQVIFYSLGITILFLVSGKGVNSSIWFKSLFPVTSSCYWYVTAYFGMFIFIPMMNIFLEHFDKRKLDTLLFSSFVVFSILPTIFNVDPFKLNRGYSMLWLCLLFLVGGYLRKYNIKSLITPSKALYFYFLSIVFTWFSKLALELITWEIVGKAKYGNIFVKYTSPSIVLAGVFLFLFFVNININNCKLIKFIKILAPASFGVYLIHLQPLIWRNIVKDFAVPLTKMSCLGMLLSVLGVSIVSYLVLSGVESLRLRLFKQLKVSTRVNDFCLCIENKIVKF